jgi:poly(A) polymerase
MHSNRSSSDSPLPDSLLPGSPPPDPSFPVSSLAQQIFEIATAEGFAARIVGGAVRDFLLRRPCGDIDMAVNMPIGDAAAAFRAAGLRVIETGLEHGTVTVLGPSDSGNDSNAGKHIIEVTQTRVDLDGDGRHATVAFNDDWRADAQRRDFTVNAIYICADGTLFDPLDGQADLAKRRLRFVGDAGERVREDALRMLRFCRFLPSFAGGGVDPAALAALTANAGLAAGLSGERVAHELARIFAAPGAASAIEVLHQTGVDLAALGQPLNAVNLGHLPNDAVFGPQQSLGWLAGLAVALPPAQAKPAAARLRLSRREARCLDQIDRQGTAEMATALGGGQWAQTSWHLLRDGAVPALVYAVSSARVGHPVSSARCQEIAGWTAPKCPVSGTDLLSHGVDNGPGLGQVLTQIELRWVASDFTVTKEALLAGI